MTTSRRFAFYEFFAGGGMVRAGLGQEWSCAFANDFDLKKAETYKRNWGDDNLHVSDIKVVGVADLPGRADLAWASFPCQDLSLAGGGAGLKGDRSGTFWPFWQLMKELRGDQRAPTVIVLENVVGTLTSHEGKDFTSIASAFVSNGYRFGAVVVDAAHFVPQSRPRLFVIAVDKDVDLPDGLTVDGPQDPWHSTRLRSAYAALPRKARADWLWWRLPLPTSRRDAFVDLIEQEPESVRWHTEDETDRLLAMMSDANRVKVAEAVRSERQVVGAVYKRTRRNTEGVKVQRAEVRFDDVAGCLRTPAGGSSRQVLLFVDGPRIRSRLISSRETARLMGLPDAYKLPDRYNEAYHLTGDGVVVPVVRHLAHHVLEPLVASSLQGRSLERAA